MDTQLEELTHEVTGLVEVANTIFEQLSVENEVVVSPIADQELFIVAAKVTTPRGVYNSWSGANSLEDLPLAIKRAEATAVRQALIYAVSGVKVVQTEAPPPPPPESPHADLVIATKNQIACSACGEAISDYMGASGLLSAVEIANKGLERFGAPLCADCYRQAARLAKSQQ